MKRSLTGHLPPHLSSAVKCPSQYTILYSPPVISGDSHITFASSKCCEIFRTDHKGLQKNRKGRRKQEASNTIILTIHRTLLFGLSAQDSEHNM